MKPKLTMALKNSLLNPERRRWAGTFLIIIGVLITGFSSVQAATQLEEGYRADFTFPSALFQPTGEKSESKLWSNDGLWWSILWSTSGNAYHIYRLNESTQDWIDTGTAVDDRDDSRSDTLWDQASQKLYVVSHRFSSNAGQSATTGNRGELYRYSYNTGSNTYTLDSGFPVEVNAATTETLIIEKDSTDRLWVTYTRDQTVYMNHSGSSDADWDPTNRPFVLPTNDTTVDIGNDDISSITTFNNNIGVMWSNQAQDTMYFAVHPDSSSPTAGWSGGVVAFGGAGSNLADDHINLASLDGDPAGAVFASTKTSETNTRNMLLVCGGDCTSSNDWTAHTAYKENSNVNNPTRPSVVIDNGNRELYVFTTARDGARDIYYKVTDLDNIQFNATTIGIPLIKDSSISPNNVTSTKQNLDGSTGLAALAATSSRYVHNQFPLSTSPIADITLIPTSNDYGDVAVNGSAPFSFEVTNVGSANLSVSPASLVGANPGEFNIDSGGGAVTLSPGQTQTIVVSFNPTSLGAKGATLRIPSNDPDENPFDVTLTGNGSTSSGGGSGTFQPTDDARVNIAFPNSNYGSADILRVRDAGGNSHESYLKFSVTGLTGAPASAKLRLFVTDSSPNGGDVHVVADNNWGESTINANNAPGISGNPVASAGSVAAGNWIELDVTSAITGNGTVSFGLTGGSSNSAFYSTKEGANPPELVIQSSGSGGQTPDITLIPAKHFYEDVVVGGSAPFSFEVRNDGSLDLNVSSSSLVGTNPGEFNIDSGAGAVTLGPGQTQTIVVSFNPTSVGGKSATLQILSDDPDEATVNVSLTGNGTPSGGGTVTVQPTDDARVNFAFPRSNYGSNSFIRVRGAGSKSHESYLKFAVTGLTGSPTSSKLRLFVTDRSPNGGDVHVVADNNWDESTINASNAPGISGSPVASAGSVTKGTWIELDVTSAITGNGIVSFGLTGGVSNSAFYSSKEGANPPELVIEN